MNRLNLGVLLPWKSPPGPKDLDHPDDPTRFRGVWGALSVLMTALLCLSVCLSCREPAPKTTPMEINSNDTPVPPVEETEREPPKAPIRVGLTDPDRWLTVERIVAEAKGGWATGSFDPKRNKLEIRTSNVERFSIDVSRVPIDWDRLVVLGMDLSNTELRRRDFDLYHFVRTQQGGWIVVEPGEPIPD